MVSLLRVSCKMTYLNFQQKIPHYNFGALTLSSILPYIKIPTKKFFIASGGLKELSKKPNIGNIHVSAIATKINLVTGLSYHF